MPYRPAHLTPSPPRHGAGSDSPTAAAFDMPCFQSLYHKDHSVLSLVATERFIFCGTQGSCIHVWGAQDFLPKRVLSGHTGSVFSMVLDAAGTTMYSGSGDGTVRAWDAVNLTCRFVLHSGPNVGDILSLAYDARTDRLFMGCQNTSIQWFSPSSADAVPKSPRELERISHNSKFFDSATSQTFALELDPEVEHYVVFDNHIRPHSHFGHVYTLLLGNLPGGGGHDGHEGGTVLFSGSGDGEVKLWTVTAAGIEPLRSLPGDITNIFAMTLSEGLLFCGCQDGLIKIWDLETFQMISELHAHHDDVLALVAASTNLFSASADGSIKVWDRNFQRVKEIEAHEGIVLALTLTPGAHYLVSGGSDQMVKFWPLPNDLLAPLPSPRFSGPAAGPLAPLSSQGAVPSPQATQQALLATLERWVTYPSVSGSPRYQHDCRRAARFLKSTFEQLGATSRLVPGAYGCNPLVVARLRANRSGTSSSSVAPTPTVLVYGHYDVFPVDEAAWTSPPFRLTGRDGFLYGRGVTDDKGPILAILYAAHELHQAKSLGVNVEFLIEGEEENGSAGLKEAVANISDDPAIISAQPDILLLSNSYWIGEEIPCLTYGLRGSIHATLEVTSDRQDVHAGVSGGAVAEPLRVLLKVLARLMDANGRVDIPGFHDAVAPPTEQEHTYYARLVRQMEAPRELTDQAEVERLTTRLMSRWRFPTLTVHKVDVSGPPDNHSIIPRSARALVSLRIVPDQTLNTVTEQFTTYVHKLFDEAVQSHLALASFASPSASPLNTTPTTATDTGDTSNNRDCTLAVTIRNTADWWLGDTTHQYFKAAERAVESQWGVKPMLIREGGTIGAVPWLENHFRTTAVNIPLGQSSDQAHLSDERIRLKNLVKGKEVMKEFLVTVGNEPVPAREIVEA
ncbi:hypothetical protein IWQ60_009207 [Tieghemiomyces parasiticus]|uniref:Peptidase M20 dimerisation domain-containing protein n=1 Tax=Tieghemiomyces parasiticus TaxID=78921 RepID=A0A9W7ZX19_9FUNG|nr:hypothetical protein IWQ60_009207 [Tieghemiomyces parasiticus]